MSSLLLSMDDREKVVLEGIRFLWIWISYMRGGRSNDKLKGTSYLACKVIRTFLAIS